jgi:SAM-dependent methyltransferase
MGLTVSNVSMMNHARTIPATLFEEHYRLAIDGDPFHYVGNHFEMSKYRLQLALLDGRHYSNILEIGCSIGVFSEMASSRADRYLGIDCSGDAIREASLRCGGRPGLSFEYRFVPLDFPLGPFDAVVLAEIGYYLNVRDLAILRDAIARETSVGATVIVTHMTAPFGSYMGRPLPSTFEDIHGGFLQDQRFRHLTRIEGHDVAGGNKLSEDGLFFVDLFERVDSRRPERNDDTLPPEFDAMHYRTENPDLENLNRTELEHHFHRIGEREGRRANELATRESFANLISPNVKTLEIGPYFSPMLRGPNVRYFDVLNREGMLSRAAAEGADGASAPEIDFVSPTGDLNIIRDGSFDAVFSSHALEHQPDIITHLRGVHRILRSGGRYFAIVPDKRYCFDHFMPESTISEMIEAFVERRQVHTLRSVLNLSVMTTHNDSIRHWNGDHGTMLEAFDERIREGMREYEVSSGSYIDVHAWQFTPTSARTNLQALREGGFTTMTLERLYATRHNTFEFWMVLRKH